MDKLVILFLAMSFSAVCFADEHTTAPSTTETTSESSTKNVKPTTNSSKKVVKKVVKKNTTASTIDAKPSPEASKENESKDK